MLVSKTKVDKIILLYHTYLFSIQETADKLNYSRRSVQYLLNKYSFVRSLSEAMYVRAKRRFNCDYFENINNEEKAYWLGFIFADGCVSKGYELTIALAERDKEHLKKFASIFDVRVNKRKFGVYTSICNKPLYNSLISLGINERKSEKTTDEIFSNIPNNLIHHFIRGILDGDGYVGIHKKDKQIRVQFSGQCIILEKIREIIYFNLKISKNKIRKMKNVNCWSLEWQGNIKAKKILDWIYFDATVFLERKKKVMLFNKS